MRTMAVAGAEVGVIAGTMAAGIGLARGVAIGAAAFIEDVGVSLYLRAGLGGVIGAASRTY